MCLEVALFQAITQGFMFFILGLCHLRTLDYSGTSEEKWGQKSCARFQGSGLEMVSVIFVYISSTRKELAPV